MLVTGPEKGILTNERAASRVLWAKKTKRV